MDMWPTYLKAEWYSPSYAFMKHTHLLRQLDCDEKRARTDGRLKPMREAMAAANLALASQTLFGTEIWFQLSQPDPPDFRLLRKSPDDGESLKLVDVEHTSYDHVGPKITLPSQLLATKFKQKSYSNSHILLIEVQSLDLNQTFAVHRAMKQRKIEYEVWLMHGRLEDGAHKIGVHALNVLPGEVATLEADTNVERARFPNQAQRLRFLRKGVRRMDDATTPTSPSQPYPWPDPFNLRY